MCTISFSGSVVRKSFLSIFLVSILLLFTYNIFAVELTDLHRTKMLEFIDNDYLPKLEHRIRQSKRLKKTDLVLTLEDYKKKIISLAKSRYDWKNWEEVVDHVIDTKDPDFIGEFLELTDPNVNNGKFALIASDDLQLGEIILRPRHFERMIQLCVENGAGSEESEQRYHHSGSDAYKIFYNQIRDQFGEFFTIQRNDTQRDLDHLKTNNTLSEMWVSAYIESEDQLEGVSLEEFIRYTKNNRIEANQHLFKSVILKEDFDAFNFLITEFSEIKKFSWGGFLTKQGEWGWSLLHYIAAFGTQDILDQTLLLAVRNKISFEVRSSGYSKLKRKKSKMRKSVPDAIFHQKTYPHDLIRKNVHLKGQTQLLKRYEAKFKNWGRQNG